MNRFTLNSKQTVQDIVQSVKSRYARPPMVDIRYSQPALPQLQRDDTYTNQPVMESMQNTPRYAQPQSPALPQLQRDDTYTNQPVMNPMGNVPRATHTPQTDAQHSYPGQMSKQKNNVVQLDARKALVAQRAGKGGIS